MGTVSLSTVISEKFLTRLAAAGQQSSTQSTNPFKSGSSSVSLGGTLRLGAQTYANAVRGLNDTLSLVNIAQGTLERLGGITDKMIELAEASAKRAVGPQGRRSLDVKFRDLVEDFKKIVEKSEFAGANFLSTDGLAELLLKVGLDRDTSNSIAAVFKQFDVPPGDNSFASERVKGERPVIIPASVFASRPSGDEYQFRKVTDAALTTTQGGISTTNSVFATADTVLNQNPGVQAIFAASSTGTLTTQPAGILINDSGIDLLAVNDVTGYSVGRSTEDLTGLGYNSGDQALFLFDPSGAVVGQLTSATGRIYTSVDMASSDERFAVTYLEGGQYGVELIDIAKGADPSAASIVSVDSSTSALSGVKIDNAGQHLVYSAVSGPRNVLRLYGTEALELDTELSRQANGSVDSLSYGFVSGGILAIARTESPGGALREVVTYKNGSGVFTPYLGGAQMEVFTTSESGTEGAYDVAFVKFDASDDRTLEVYRGPADGGSSLTYSAALGTAPVTSISAARNIDDADRVDVGIVAALPSLFGDSDTEFYRIGFNPASVTGRRLSNDSTEYAELFDSARNINSRPAAYRVLSDLKALREQISTNVAALKSAVDVVGQNIELVRATGLALLEIGDGLTNETDAAAVAELLRRRIREQAPQALAQAENLDPIAVATLTYSGSGN